MLAHACIWYIYMYVLRFMMLKIIIRVCDTCVSMHHVIHVHACVYIYNNVCASMHVVLMHACKWWNFMYSCAAPACMNVIELIVHRRMYVMHMYGHTYMSSCVLYTHVFMWHIWMYRTHVFMFVCDTWGSRSCGHSKNFQSRTWTSRI